MSVPKYPNIALCLLLFLVGGGVSQITPQNAWRTLIVYTNTIDSIYGGTLPQGSNMYSAYFSGLIDDLNATYSKSGVDIRAQIAGVIWDKAYVLDTPSTAGLRHLYDRTNGMERWTHDSILNRYGVDVVVLVHNPRRDPSIGGTAFVRAQASTGNYSGLWVRNPVNSLNFIHEAGHMYSNNGNYDHCSGHRMVFDSAGNVLAGPSPDTMPFVAITSSDEPAHLVVEMATAAQSYGFHTTMAYANGHSEYCWDVFTHTYGGVLRVFRRYHQGAVGLNVGWTGSYSNPSKTWMDPLTHAFYPTGYDTVTYINRLKYLGSPTVSSLNYTGYKRNFSAILNDQKNFITDLRGIPENLQISERASLGVAGADSQWVYSHFAAAHSIVLKPGFKVKAGASARMTVGNFSGLGRRGNSQSTFNPEARFDGASLSAFNFRYEGSEAALFLSSNTVRATKISVSIYDLRGARKVDRSFANPSGEGFSQRISLQTIPSGPYFVRVVAGEHVFQRKFFKW